MRVFIFAFLSVAMFANCANAQGVQATRSAKSSRVETAFSKAQLRDIERLLIVLDDQSRELHAEFHEHLEGVPHGEKLEADAVEIEKTAGQLRAFVSTANGDSLSVARIRGGTNYFIQNSFEISRTIDLAASWVRTGEQRKGISHMREAAQDVIRTAMQIEAYLPPNAFEVDGQVEQLEDNIKELYAEFQEHLRGYEVSNHLDTDLVELGRLVEHMHELCHGRTWQQIDMAHLSRDIQEVRQKTTHIESLFVQQSRIGVLTRDFIGIEHSRDAITDVLSASYLLDFMIAKTSPGASRVGGVVGGRQGSGGIRRPRRDR